MEIDRYKDKTLICMKKLKKITYATDIQSFTNLLILVDS